MSQPASVPARTLLDAIEDAGITDVVAVPDTHQRTLIDLLVASPQVRFIQATTEDEAMAIACGLLVGGRKPMLQIQHAGLYACVNNLRGVGIDGELPVVLLIGLLGRDPSRAPRESFDSMVRLSEPLLDALQLPHFLIDGPDDVDHLGEAVRLADERQGPVAVLVGMQTA
jgi:sulfopyruvate decarboxylase TPP-binding subunit